MENDKLKKLINTEGSKRKLSAILSADAKDYSRLMSQDEMGTIRTLTGLNLKRRRNGHEN
jgi:hypothetical protein